MKRMAAKWEKVREDMFNDLPAEIVNVLEITFYRGALSLIAAANEHVSDSAQPTGADLKVIDELHDELNEFFLDHSGEMHIA